MLGLRIKKLERIYGVEHGGDRKSNPKVSEMNQEQLADMIGISVDTLQNYKKLTKMIPELEELVDTGFVTNSMEKEIHLWYDKKTNCDRTVY